MSKLPLTLTSCLEGSMRHLGLVMLLASAIGSAHVVVTAERQRPDGGRPPADIPKEFEFLFQSPEQRAREAAQRATYWEDLWKGLPYDSISLEQTRSTRSKVTLHRAAPGQLRGRAELSTRRAGTSLPGALPEASSLLGPGISDVEGSVDLYTFANLSYLLHRTRFLQLPDLYDPPCSNCASYRLYETLSVTAGGKTKTVTDSGVLGGIPPELWAIKQAFDLVSKSIQWTQK